MGESGGSGTFDSKQKQNIGGIELSERMEKICS